MVDQGGIFSPPFEGVCSAIKFTLIAIPYAFCGLTLWLRARLLPAS